MTMASLFTDVLGYTTPEHVTHWGARIALTVGVLVVIVLAVLGMRRGWQNKAKRQQDLPAPASVPAGDVTPINPATPGTYLASTTSGNWLDRVVVQSLGVPSKASVTVRPDGVAVEREGEPEFFIPVADLRAVRLDRGIAGEVYEAGSVLLITWVLGDTELDSGFRAEHTAAVVPLATAIRSLLGAASDAAVPDAAVPAPPQAPTQAPTEGAS